MNLKKFFKKGTSSTKNNRDLTGKINKDIDQNLGYDLEDEANENIKIIRKNTMLPYRRLVTLYQQAVYCEQANISGSFTECGVWKGGAVGLMALANLNHGNNYRDLYLFDSFDDIGEPDPTIDGERAVRDAEIYGGKNESELTGKVNKPMKGAYDAFGGYGSLKENKNLLQKVIQYPSNYINYNKGWFEDTLPKVAKNMDKIAILRLDGDWYKSIKVCLEYLYPKVVKGGFVIIDDYNYYKGCTKALDEFLNTLHEKPYLHHIDAHSRYIVVK